MVTMHFFILFALLFGIPYYLLLYVLPLKPLLEAIASFLAFALNATGFTSTATGTLLASNDQLFEIVPSCSGFVMIILMFALLYSTPVKKPLRFLALYAPVLFLFNIYRLYAAIALGSTWPELAEPVHFYYWFIDAFLVLFLWFLAFATNPSKNKTP
ncbi:exosortase/archaeosortase family protein [Candidatus Micrarchaeota archaeon]|nr:exosortase/archaeosortase family protein [Candidatus Micrarchaeota archaeon]